MVIAKEDFIFFFEEIFKITKMSPEKYFEKYFEKGYFDNKEIKTINEMTLVPVEFISRFIYYAFNNENKLEKIMKTFNSFILFNIKEDFIYLKNIAEKVFRPKEDIYIDFEVYDKEKISDINYFFESIKIDIKEDSCSLDNLLKKDISLFTEKEKEKFFYENFSFKNTENYLSLLVELSKEIEKSKSINSIKLFFLIQNFTFDELYFYSFIRVLETMKEILDSPVILLFEKNIILFYLKSVKFLGSKNLHYFSSLYSEDKIKIEEKDFSEFKSTFELNDYDLSVLKRKSFFYYGINNIIDNNLNIGVEIFRDIKNDYNLNNKILLAGVFSINYIRRVYAKEYKISNNKNIECVIKNLEEFTGFILENIEKLGAIQRLPSLVFMKNSIKIHYNHYTNEFKEKDLIDQYFKEVMVLVKNKIFISPNTFSKLYEILIQIQMMYNNLPLDEYRNIKNEIEEYFEVNYLLNSDFCRNIIINEVRDDQGTELYEKTKIDLLNYIGEFIFNSPSFLRKDILNIGKGMKEIIFSFFKKNNNKTPFKGIDFVFDDWEYLW